MKLFLSSLFNQITNKPNFFLSCFLSFVVAAFFTVAVAFAQVDSAGLSVTATNEIQPEVEKIVVVPPRVVVIDAGHGGRDEGIVNEGFDKEKDFVFEIALEIKNKIRNKKNIDVYLTRERDLAMSLLERVAFANKKEADVFVSLHQCYQAVPASEPILRIYYNQKVKDPTLEAIRTKNINAGTKILPWDLGQNGQLSRSKKLGVYLHEAWGGYKEQKYPYSLPLAVLRGVHAPAVLVEIPLEVETQMNHLADSEDQIGADGIQTEIAGRIATGIIRFLENR